MKQSTSTPPAASAFSCGCDIDAANHHSLSASSSCDVATKTPLMLVRPDRETHKNHYNNYLINSSVPWRTLLRKKESEYHQLHPDDHYNEPDNPSLDIAEKNYSSPSSRTTTTKILVLTLLLFLAAVAIISNNQVIYNDKWSMDNNVISDTSTSDFATLENDATETNPRRRDSSGTSSGSGTSTTTALLTRTSQLSTLLSNLDASDVIECYIVTRMANLANVETYSSSGGNNRRNIETLEKEDDENTLSSSSSSIPTGPVLIRKAALAFRYRPKVASVSHVPTTPSLSNDPSDSTTMLDQQKYFELTLEYGPQRAGATKTSESMPMVHVDMEVLAKYNEGRNDDGTNNNNIGKYVAWDNLGSIYYSTHISNEWSGAYYMAPITGVVLEKILEKAVEYPTKRPRYQPFEVVSIPSNTIILKSSGSDDFVWDMFRDLADLYVDIDPILVPPRGKVQFYVADPTVEEDNEVDKEGLSGDGTPRSEEEMKRQRGPNPNVKRVDGAVESSKAAIFYENFFNCANAKRTGDYSMYLPLVSSAPSPVPPLDEDDTIVSNTTLDMSKADVVDDGSNGDGSLRRLEEGPNSTIASFSQNEYNLDAEVDVKGDDNIADSSPPSGSEEVGEDAETNEVAIGVAAEGDKETVIDDDDNNEIETIDFDENNIDSEDDGDAAKAAEIAALEAAQKAETAAAVAATNSSSPEDSAKAASEAAVAAKKAADASVASRAKSAAEGLLSGDGAMMTSILSSCFSDPKYRIRKVYEEQSATYVYVYLDGDVFIRLNLTAPYWGASTVLQTVPPPHAHVVGQGDVVDWAIFLLLVGGTVFGFLVMIHQLGVSIDKRLQFRHVFHPLVDDDIEMEERLEKGGGIPHSIGIDAIPVSLGGKLSHYSGSHRDGPPSSYKDQLSDSSIDDVNNGLLDIEVANRDNIVPANSPEATRSDLPLSLRLKEEAPDLVERPTLKSKSKVALPHSSPRVCEQERALQAAKKAGLPLLPRMT
eukprot:scaffold4250_cov125-Skeletonema_menzelii.AAC.2